MEGISKSITPCFEQSIITEQSQSLSVTPFFDDNYDDTYDDTYDDDIGYNGLSEDYDPNQPLEPLIPFKYTSTLSSTTSSLIYGCGEDEDDDSDDAKHIEDNSDQENDKNVKAVADKEDKDKENKKAIRDKFEMFFNSFIDMEMEGEVNVCQWISSLKELSNELSEKDIYKLFSYIDSERTGYLDSVDFISFCKKFKTNNVDDIDDDGCIDIKRLQSVLIKAIKDHPFYNR